MMKRRVGVVMVVILLLTAVPVAVRGEGAPPGLTGGLLETSSAAVPGQVQDQSVGWAVAIAGDVNGDGFDDVLVGAPGNEESVGYVPRVFLFLGGVERARWNLEMTEAWADAVFEGESAGDLAGFSVAGAGDFNGDGYDDMLIGAPGATSWDGKVYLILGSATPAGGNLGSADAIYSGNSGAETRAGWSVAAAGDVDADGYDDILVGAPGDMTHDSFAYLILGTTDGFPINADLSTADTVIEPRTSRDSTGYSVAGVGDVNGDGYDDMLFGAPQASSQDGEAHLVLGSSSLGATLNLGSADRHYWGIASQFLGWAVAGAGDVNGDGLDDMLVSFTGGTGGGAYLILGAFSPKANCSLDLSCNDEGYRGPAGSSTGGRVSGVGDVNADGYADIMIGAAGYDNGDSTGRVSLILGHPNPGGVKDLSPDADAHYLGNSPGEQGCVTQAGWGDVNGDGLSDLVVGSPGWSAKRGQAYLILGDGVAPSSVRYRDVNLTGEGAAEVGQSGVTVDYPGPASQPGGSVFVTRHFRNTCSAEFTTHGLLWTIESNVSQPPGIDYTFKYNDWQIGDWNEPDLRLWYRERPCDEWTLDPTSEWSLDIEHNEIGAYVLDPGSAFARREYTLSPSPPSPTALQLGATGVRLAQEPLWLVIGLAALVILTAALDWRRKRLQ